MKVILRHLTEKVSGSKSSQIQSNYNTIDWNYIHIMLVYLYKKKSLESLVKETNVVSVDGAAADNGEEKLPFKGRDPQQNQEGHLT